MDSMEHPIQGLMKTAMEKIKDMIDVNTVVGDPVPVGEGTVVIPVSKVSFGFAAGGSDFPSKGPKDLFGGGSGAGISVNPLAFLVVNGEDVKLLQISSEANQVTQIIEKAPEIIETIKNIFAKKNSDE